MRVHVLVLNYNGRRLLAECLPSVLEAAGASRHACDVAVIDNDSRDASVPWLGEHFPQVRVIARPNRGLCSFNDVLPGLEGPVAILLNNDVRLDRRSIDPWVAPLRNGAGQGGPRCFMAAPRAYGFDGQYEGYKTAVEWRFGLVRATALFAGHAAAARASGWTASAGAALAVDRRAFLDLGGFDPIYLPGRLEDLDLAFRAYLAGYHAEYVPEAVVWHRGMATFGRVFGREGCDQLALRNTLLFQWKNLRSLRGLARQAGGLGVRLVWDQVRAPFAAPGRRWAFTRAFLGAAARLARAAGARRLGLRAPVRPAAGQRTRRAREREFFARFHPAAVAQRDAPVRESVAVVPRAAAREAIEVYA